MLNSFQLIEHALPVGFRFRQFVCEHLESSNLNYSLVTSIPLALRGGQRLGSFHLDSYSFGFKLYFNYLRETLDKIQTNVGSDTV